MNLSIKGFLRKLISQINLTKLIDEENQKQLDFLAHNDIKMEIYESIFNGNLMKILKSKSGNSSAKKSPAKIYKWIYKVISDEPEFKEQWFENASKIIKELNTNINFGKENIFNQVKEKNENNNFQVSFEPAYVQELNRVYGICDKFFRDISNYKESHFLFSYKSPFSQTIIAKMKDLKTFCLKELGQPAGDLIEKMNIRYFILEINLNEIIRELNSIMMNFLTDIIIEKVKMKMIFKNLKSNLANIKNAPGFYISLLNTSLSKNQTIFKILNDVYYSKYRIFHCNKKQTSLPSKVSLRSNH